jgi:hypothetical protein
MKAITIKNPWACLIVKGIKDIENRMWKTAYRGKLLIHVGKTDVCNPDDFSLYTEEQIYAIGEAYGSKVLTTVDPLLYIHSAIIGSVNIVDCIVDHPSIWAEHSLNPLKPIYNWVLDDPHFYETPILNVKGQLKIFDFPTCIDP